MDIILENKTWVLALLLAISEALSLNPNWKTNGILQGLISFLKFLKETENNNLKK